MRRIEEFLGLSPFEWSDEYIPRANRFEELRQSIGWQKLLGPNLFPFIRGITPGFVRRLLKPLGLKPDQPPPVTDRDIDRLFEQLREDLKYFYEMMGEQVELWPSVQRLNCEPVPGRDIQSVKR